jgi:hypothetical protein
MLSDDPCEAYLTGFSPQPPSIVVANDASDHDHRHKHHQHCERNQDDWPQDCIFDQLSGVPTLMGAS